ncbi:DUF6876 family protein [Paremcibacter congregatus]|jgi:hypothetical protein|uniref:DUF6876 family protein n=1 Tax=Paremcibacter congregatus TaxID=2043170 RepID=UPI0030EE6D06|tara:strand:+ start:671 stop:1039 length:369 start_codon:yes stop_codon:yes gene_type:complete
MTFQTLHTLTENDLANFTGSESFYRHPLYPFVYTDGVQYVANQGGAYWLIDIIGSYQFEPRIAREPFQHWVLTVNADKTAVIICSDGNGAELARQDISYTDFPLDNIGLFLTDKTLLLTSEY